MFYLLRRGASTSATSPKDVETYTETIYCVSTAAYTQISAPLQRLSQRSQATNILVNNNYEVKLCGFRFCQKALEESIHNPVIASITTKETIPQIYVQTNF
jgi:hypothetical protein